MIYRYIGTESEIGQGIRLDSLGQTIRLEQAAALDVMKGGCLLVSEETYKSLGFTEDEEKKYRFPGSRAGATPEFKAKLAKGVAKWQQFVDEAGMGIAPSVIAVDRSREVPVEPPPAPSALKETKV